MPGSQPRSVHGSPWRPHEGKSTLRKRTADAWLTWWQVLLLGLLTVGAYGLVVYGFSVFIGPIRDDTGWSMSALSGAFTLSSLAGGVGGAGTGWLLDRAGARPVLLGSLLSGSALLMAAASAPGELAFVLAWGAGGGFIGAGLFYNVTMALTARLYPAERVRAFSILTFVGGFAAVIYFPLAGLLVDLLPWRTAMRVLIVLLIVHVLPAAVLVKGGGAASGPGPGSAAPGEGGRGVRDALLSREVILMMAMFSLAAMAFAAIQVLHVPAMAAGGASLGVATAVASARGILSLPGRALMGPVVERFGVMKTLGLVYVLMAIGTLPLAAGGHVAMLLVFMVLTGLSFGTISPLHGLYAADVYGERRIGTLMGLQSLVVSLLSALGPVLLGLTVDASGGYGIAVVCMAAAFGAALLLLLLLGRSVKGPGARPA
ncbi:MAG: MFS transporter [Chloroflexi bacterium CFX7]|nr:MAG: MFS transporter [bacterium]MCE7928032.1 MFS transporter [Chloroflexi bacterium CFX7]